MAASGWLTGKVKAVPSGDTLVIMMRDLKEVIPPEKSITLSFIIAPRLAWRHGTDEPFAWDSREFLRKLCIGKDVRFKVDYIIPGTGREFGTVYLDDKNVAGLVVSQGFAKVKKQGNKGEGSPYATEMLILEGIARDQSLGCWSKEHKAVEASVRILPTSSIREASASGVKGFIAEMKGRALNAIVEQVRDGSTLRVYLIPSFHFCQVYVAGVQAPSMGKHASIPNTVPQTKTITGEESNETQAPMMAVAAQKKQHVVSPVAYSEIPPDRFGKEAKHFAETRVLSREVRIVLEGTDSFDNMFGSVYYSDGNNTKDLALELVENVHGFAKYVEWSANMLEVVTKKKLKNGELKAKKERLRIWTGFKPPVTNTKPIRNQNFSGKVIEVVNGYCIIVADDAACGNPLVERRVNISSIRPPKVVDPSGENKTVEHFARAAKEFLRTRLIGKQVPAKRARDFLHLLKRNRRHSAIVEYVFSGHRFKLTIPNETCIIAFAFSGVRCPAKNEPYSDEAIALMRRRILQRDVEIEIEAVDKTGTFLGSLWESKTNMATVLLEAGLAKLSSFGLDRISDSQTLIRAEQSAKKNKLKVWENYNDSELVSQESMTKETYKVIVTEVLGGGKFYVQIVGDHRLAIIQQKLASLELNDQLEAVTAEGPAYILPDTLEGQDNTSEVQAVQNNQVVSLQPRWSSLFKDQLDTLNDIAALETMQDGAKAKAQSEATPFNPSKGDLVLAQFSLDNSWNRAMIVSEYQGGMEREFLVFYIDYGNQEIVPYNCLRPVPIDQSIELIPPLAKLCSLAFIKVPDLMDDLGEQAAEYLSMLLLGKGFTATIEECANVGAKLEGQGTGQMLILTLVDEDDEISINAAMLENGLAHIVRKRWNSRERNLEQFEEYARKEHRGVWSESTLTS
nr:unnamed protein product [Digitaria exilis]